MADVPTYEGKPWRFCSLCGSEMGWRPVKQPTGFDRATGRPLRDAREAWACKGVLLKDPPLPSHDGIQRLLDPDSYEKMPHQRGLLRETPWAEGE